MGVTSGKISKRAKAKQMAEKRWKLRTLPNECVNINLENKQKPCSVPSTTSKKIGIDLETEVPTNETPHSDCDYMFIHMVSLRSLFSKLLCNECSQNTVVLQRREQHGFAFRLVIKCTNCDVVLDEHFSSPRLETTNAKTRGAFDVNKKMVQSFSRFGKGYGAMEQFCIGMSMNVMSSSNYYKLLELVCKEAASFGNRTLEDARDRVRLAHIEENPELEGKEIIDISVSYDGTWHTRGHRSNYGIGCVIDVLTGLVVDFEIMSKYCHACVITEKLLGKDSLEFFFCNEGHISTCEKNFSGSSPAMEMHAAEKLWRRSEEAGFRYTVLVSDGDAKTHLHLKAQKIYGDVTIEKHECVNHIAKRVGTGLRNMVKDWKKKKVTLGGKQHGSLKESTIKKLTNYYRAAIVNNVPDVDKMKTAVYATLYHCMSTDENPQHKKCPKGKLSWCFYNKCIALGEVPGRHRDNIHTPLSTSIVAKIMPVYQRLASDILLGRCTGGMTQNANESLHSVIWSKCPKETFVSQKKILLGLVEAVSQFNKGCLKTEQSRELSTPLSSSQKKICLSRDRRRVKQSVRCSLHKEKFKRKATLEMKLHEEEALLEQEGKTYGAGEF